MAREALRQQVLVELEPLVAAQIAKAKGIRHLVIRNKNTGKFERVTDPKRIIQLLNDDAKGQHETWEIWTRDPDTSAFTDLMNRALDKPKEQSVDVNVAVDWDKRIARMKAARQRLGEKV